MKELDLLRMKARQLDVKIKVLKEQLYDLEDQNREIGKQIVARIEMGNQPVGKSKISFS